MHRYRCRAIDHAPEYSIGLCPRLLYYDIGIFASRIGTSCSMARVRSLLPVVVVVVCPRIHHGAIVTEEGQGLMGAPT